MPFECGSHRVQTGNIVERISVQVRFSARATAANCIRVSRHEVARKIRSHDVLEVLADLFVRHGPLEYLRSDNGPEVHREARAAAPASYGLSVPRAPDRPAGQAGHWVVVQFGLWG